MKRVRKISAFLFWIGLRDTKHLHKYILRVASKDTAMRQWKEWEDNIKSKFWGNVEKSITEGQGPIRTVEASWKNNLSGHETESQR
jgi:hypothetical protein